MVARSQCWSNGRLKGENNAKCGNRYLAWAFVEAANYAAHSYQQAQAFVARKTAQTNRALAVKALANKLCRASYWVMKEQVKFEPARLFGSLELAGTEEPENRLAPSHEFDWTSVPAVCFPRHLGCRGGRRRPDRKPLSVWSLTFGLRRTFDVVAAVDDSSAPAASAWIRSGTHAFLGPQAKARDGWREVGLAPAGR